MNVQVCGTNTYMRIMIQIKKTVMSKGGGEELI